MSERGSPDAHSEHRHGSPHTTIGPDRGVDSLAVYWFLESMVCCRSIGDEEIVTERKASEL